MEFRNRKLRQRSDEYEELKTVLTGMGLFEADMEMVEMHEIVQAIQLSEASAAENDNSQAFMHAQSKYIFNSTMIDLRSRRQLASPSSSPEYHFEQFEVRATVHHPMEWSPPAPRDRLATDSGKETKCSLRKRAANDAADQENSLKLSKYLRLDSIEDNNLDSGVSLSNSTTPTLSPQKPYSNETTPKKINKLEVPGFDKTPLKDSVNKRTKRRIFV